MVFSAAGEASIISYYVFVRLHFIKSRRFVLVIVLGIVCVVFLKNEGIFPFSETLETLSDYARPCSREAEGRGAYGFRLIGYQFVVIRMKFYEPQCCSSTSVQSLLVGYWQHSLFLERQVRYREF